MAALLQSQGREADSVLEAAALRVATAQAEELRLANERVLCKSTASAHGVYICL
jgi:hypothetical protein